MDAGETSLQNIAPNLYKTESNSQTSASPGDYSNYTSRNSRFDSSMQNALGESFPPGPDVVSSFPPDYSYPIDLSAEAKLNMAHQNSYGDVASMPNMIMQGIQPPSVGGIGTDYHQRPSSMGRSDPWSPTSSRDHPQTSDENLPAHGSDRKKVPKGEEKDDDKPPAWSELKTKAGKERKRLPLACIACRRKKIRCSGEKPACKHCLRSRIPCVYKVTTRKAAPRTDYMAMLDKRLKRMEERVIKVIPKDELPDMSVVGRANVRPAIPTSTAKTAKPSATKKRTAGDAFTKELEEWTKSRGQPTLPESVLRKHQAKAGEENTLLTEGADFLPSEELQEHLAEVFFECLYGQSYLLLHKPSFMRKLKAGTVPPVLILAVCAISARFSTHPDVSTEPAFLRGDSWASPARAIVERRHYEPNITILTVMLILGLHYFGTCEGGLSWSFGGQAMRMAYALQLHRELDHDPLGRKMGKSSELSFTDREIRRRTMWACFLMDRFNSSGTERPPFGAELYLRIQLPIKESHFQMEIPGPTEDLDGGVPNPITPGSGQISDPKDNMGVGAYVIRAVVLWGRVVNYLNLGGKAKDPYQCWNPESGFTLLQRQIREFIESLPPLLVWSQENLQNHTAEKLANQFIYLHIICQQNLLFLHRFAIPVTPGARPPRDIPKDFLTESGKVVIDAAAQISRLIDAASGHSVTAPFAGYCAYAASTVHVWGIHSKQSQLEAASKENLRHVYKYLNKMKNYWGMFHYMAESVKDIYRAFADAALKGASRPGSGNPQPMFQYGDWFDKYPHGVSRTDWVDSGPGVKKEPGTEAVMSHQSELQSVEEFFASLSPPSKADNPRKAARRSTKSAGESTRNKKHPSKLDVSAAQAQSASQRAGADTAGLPNSDLSATSITMNDHTPVFSSDHSSQPFQNHSTGADFNLGSAGPYHSQFLNPHQLPQLDRQLVFGAYAGLENSHANLGSLHNSNFQSSNVWDGVDLNGMATGGSGNHNGYFGGNNEASSAWFMPFNMEPPEIGRDNMSGLFADVGMAFGSFSGQGGQGVQGGDGSGGGMVDLDMGGLGEEVQHDGTNG